MGGINPGICVDKSDAHLITNERPSSGLSGEIFSSIKGKLYRKPSATIMMAKTEMQKNFILEHMRDQIK